VEIVSEVVWCNLVLLDVRVMIVMVFGRGLG